VYVVAITELATPVEQEAAALAADLGTTPYEERLNLASGLPAVVLTAADRARALALLKALRARGHGAVAIDAAVVVSSEAMVSMRRFGLEEGALTAEGERLPHGEILALIRAMHRTRTETRAEVKTKKFSPGRALVTGGLLVSKTVSREETSITEESQQVLYIFRADGGTPWLLRERGTQYAALGGALSPSSAQNFLTAIARLRERAPQAVYDERLMATRKVPSRVAVKGGGAAGSASVSSASGVDLLAHLIALWVGRGARF